MLTIVMSVALCTCDGPYDVCYIRVMCMCVYIDEKHLHSQFNSTLQIDEVHASNPETYTRTHHPLMFLYTSKSL